MFSGPPVSIVAAIIVGELTPKCRKFDVVAEACSGFRPAVGNFDGECLQWVSRRCSNWLSPLQSHSLDSAFSLCRSNGNRLCALQKKEVIQGSFLKSTVDPSTMV